MKVSIAVIKLVLRTNKVLADGSHPIMLRVSFNGMKEKSSGYSCTEKYWDKKNECVKKGFPNFVMVNAELKKLKDEAISRRDRYIALGEVYSPSMILEKEDVRNVLTNDLHCLISSYIAEKGLSSSSTVGKWWCMYRNVCEFVGRKDILINEINEGFCRRYASWLEGKGISVGTIRGYLGVIGAICHYAIVKGLINDYPFREWKYNQKYKEAKNELYIHSRTIDVMMEMFLDELIIMNGSRWSYRDGVIEELMDIHSDLYAHYLYMIGFYMKGLSPVDISMLKKKDIKVVQIKDVSCYAIDGFREKSGQRYKIRIRQNCIESNVLIRTMLMFNNGDYFMPTLNGYNGKFQKKKVSNVYIELSDKLVNWFRRVNEEIAKRNVENGHIDDIPLIDLECRYYSYRHSYIMSELQKPSVNLLALAQSVGKSPKTLHQYISLLGDSDLI